MYNKNDLNVQRFPVFSVGTILNPFEGNFNIKNINAKYREISILYPCRLDAMAINPAAVAYNENLRFTPGEVALSIDNFIKTKVCITNLDGGNIVISPTTKRKALIKHAYYLITKILNVNPSVYIDVNDEGIPKHCGFGSSTSIITSVVASINELYGNPIKKKDLIRYLSSNHGEEINDSDNKLKSVQSIGGGASSGLLSFGLIVIAGSAVPIAGIKLPKTKVVIGIPKDFVALNADILMKLEEDNLWKFVKTGRKYKNIIAYRLLHNAIPNMLCYDISALSDVVFDYRFNMGSIKNCSFSYPKMVKISNQLRGLYEEKKCKMLSLSSVGPAFFALDSVDKNIQFCKKKMEEVGMRTYTYSIYNSSYKIIERKK